MARKHQEPRRLRVYEQWQGNEVGLDPQEARCLIRAPATCCTPTVPNNPARSRPVIHTQRAATAAQPACSGGLRVHSRLCHHVDACCASVCAEVLLLGRVRDWPQLEVWYGLPGTPDRSHHGLPGLCGTLHVEQCQPSVLDCQVRGGGREAAGWHQPHIPNFFGGKQQQQQTARACVLTQA